MDFNMAYLLWVCVETKTHLFAQKLKSLSEVPNVVHVKVHVPTTPLPPNCIGVANRFVEQTSLSH